MCDKNKCQCLTTCTSLVLRNYSDPFFKRIISSDEKWITYDNPPRSGQWVDVLEPPDKVVKRDIHSRRQWLLLAVHVRCNLVWVYQTRPNHHIWCLLRTACIMNEKLKIQQPALINTLIPLLIHDNVRLHNSKLTVQKLKDLGYETHLPDISDSDFCFFVSLSNFLAWKYFKTQDEVENTFQNFINFKNMSFYKSGIEKLVESWLKVIVADDDYFNE